MVGVVEYSTGESEVAVGIVTFGQQFRARGRLVVDLCFMRDDEYCSAIQ